MRIVQGSVALKGRILGIVHIFTDAFAPADIEDVTGIKPQISINLGASVTGDLDIVKLSPIRYGIALSEEEAAALAPSDFVEAWVPAAAGRLESTRMEPGLTFAQDITGAQPTQIGLTPEAVEAVGDEVVPRTFRALHYTDGYGVERLETPNKRLNLIVPGAASVEVPVESDTDRETIVAAGAAVL
jgi:hypothetical protein